MAHGGLLKDALRGLASTSSSRQAPDLARRENVRREEDGHRYKAAAHSGGSGTWGSQDRSS
jgi:hypothetical protein